MKFATRVVHAGMTPDPSTGSVNVPVYQTSTFVQESPGIHKGYAYSRSSNPTRTAFETAISALENGKHGLAFSSGIAAIDAVFRLCLPGDEVVTTKDIYGGSYRLFRNIFEPLGIRFVWTDFSQKNLMESALSAKTKLIWLETPTNPLLNIIDLEMVASIAKKHGVMWAADNTFATPSLQRPLDLGADIVVHSATKYLGGHSDIIMGATVVNDDELYEKLRNIQTTCGAIPGPNDCFLALRGIRTLHLRMERSCANAEKIAAFLQSHKAVRKVNFPGLPGHPGREIAKKQMAAFGAMISFHLHESSMVRPMLEKLRIFTLAESLGGVESLCGYPAVMSHGSMNKEERAGLGIDDTLIRLSVGIEDARDLIDDLGHAMS
jgi:cystathionine beta-lyase